MSTQDLPCNSPRRTPGERKKFVVRACQNGKSKVIRYGDPDMTIKKNNPERRRSFRARHKCDSNPPNKLTARAWSCKNW
jgi:hypothetical protein